MGFTPFILFKPATHIDLMDFSLGFGDYRFPVIFNSFDKNSGLLIKTK